VRIRLRGKGFGYDDNNGVPEIGKSGVNRLKERMLWVRVCNILKFG